MYFFCALFLEHIRVPIVVFYNWNQKLEGIRVQKMSLIHNLNVFELIFWKKCVEGVIQEVF